MADKQNNPFQRMIFDIDDIKGDELKGFERTFVRFLLGTFGITATIIIYNSILKIITFFRIIGVYLSMPFKFVQFWKESYKNQSNNKTQ